MPLGTQRRANSESLAGQRYGPEHQTTSLLMFSHISDFISMTSLSAICYPFPQFINLDKTAQKEG